MKLRTRPRAAVAQRFRMPEPVTPFTVLGLLREIQQNNGLPAPQMHELAGSIERVERHYFAETDGDPIDLHQVAEIVDPAGFLKSRLALARAIRRRVTAPANSNRP